MLALPRFRAAAALLAVIIGLILVTSIHARQLSTGWQHDCAGVTLVEQIRAGVSRVTCTLAVAAAEPSASPAPVSPFPSPTVPATATSTPQPSPTVTPTIAPTSAPTATPRPTFTPTPPASGKQFVTLKPGSPLPSGADCAARVRRSAWEPYSGANKAYNERAVVGGVDYNLAPVTGAYKGDHNTRAQALQARVDGQFTGTTDEIIQWGACKYGIDEDLARAQAYMESAWRAAAIGDIDRLQLNADGTLYKDANGKYVIQRVDQHGAWPRAMTDSELAIAASVIWRIDLATATKLTTDPTSWAYPLIHNSKGIPASTGLLQIKARFAPGALSASATSTAFNVDYAFARWRICYDGLYDYLAEANGKNAPGYAAGDELGCVGLWFDGGAWKTTAAQNYITGVQTRLQNRAWTTLK
jgi:hypothetical protein